MELARLQIVLVACLFGCGQRTAPSDPPILNDTSRLEGNAAGNSTSNAGKASSDGQPSEIQAGWGTIKGRLVWGLSELPKPRLVEITKDVEYCRQGGPIVDSRWEIDDKTKGINSVCVWLRRPARVHPMFPKDANEVRRLFEVEFEKLNKQTFSDFAADLKAKRYPKNEIHAPGCSLEYKLCQYVPKVLAVREGQPVIVQNRDTVEHNLAVFGPTSVNDSNAKLSPGAVTIYAWKREPSRLDLQCYIHNWMQMHAYVFDHPYFALSDRQGRFELKNVPSGVNRLVIRATRGFYNATTGEAATTAGGTDLQITPGQVVDLGEIKIRPSDADL